MASAPPAGFSCETSPGGGLFRRDREPVSLVVPRYGAFEAAADKGDDFIWSQAHAGRGYAPEAATREVGRPKAAWAERDDLEERRAFPWSPALGLANMLGRAVDATVQWKAPRAVVSMLNTASNQVSLLEPRDKVSTARARRACGYYQQAHGTSCSAHDNASLEERSGDSPSASSAGARRLGTNAWEMRPFSSEESCGGHTQFSGSCSPSPGTAVDDEDEDAASEAERTAWHPPHARAEEWDDEVNNLDWSSVADWASRRDLED